MLHDNISLKGTFILRFGKTRRMQCPFLKRNFLYYTILFCVCLLLIALIYTHVIIFIFGIKY